MERVRKDSSRASLGLLLIIAGLVLLLGTLNLMPAWLDNIVFRWPMILIVFGLLSLIRKDYTPALILFAVGGFFMLPHLFPEVGSIYRFWPLLIVFAGFLFVRRKETFLPHQHLSAVNDDYIEELAVFGGGLRHVETGRFTGGKITNVFGGSEINLEKCELSEQGAVLDIVAVFGGSKIIVPRNWAVKTEVVSIFGGFVDKRTYFNDQSVDKSRVLVVKGVTLFGGGEVRNV